MLQTRSWEQDGDKRYTTEIALKNFNSTILMLDGKGDRDAALWQTVGVQSRAEIDHDRSALYEFKQLKGEYEAWRLGR